MVPTAGDLVRACPERLDRRQNSCTVAAPDAKLAVAVVPACKECSMKRAATLINRFDERVMATARYLIDLCFDAREYVVEGYTRELPLMSLVPKAQLS